MSGVNLDSGGEWAGLKATGRTNEAGLKNGGGETEQQVGEAEGKTDLRGWCKGGVPRGFRNMEANVKIDGLRQQNKTRGGGKT